MGVDACFLDSITIESFSPLGFAEKAFKIILGDFSSRGQKNHDFYKLFFRKSPSKPVTFVAVASESTYLESTSPQLHFGTHYIPNG